MRVLYIPVTGKTHASVSPSEGFGVALVGVSLLRVMDWRIDTLHPKGENNVLECNSHVYIRIVRF